MANKIISGSDLMLFKNGKSLAASTSCSLNLQVEEKENSSKDNGCWRSSFPGIMSFDMTTDNLFTVEDYSSLVDALIAKEPIEMQFSVVGNRNGCAEVGEEGWTPLASSLYKGNVIITSISATASNGEAATYSATFSGVGALTKVVA